MLVKRHRTSDPKEVLKTAVLVVGLALLFSSGVYAATVWAGEEFWQRAGYPGVFLLSFIGASSVVIPIPYTVILLAIASAFDPLLFAVAVGIGSALGETIGYALGYTGRQIVSEERREQLDAMGEMFKRYGLAAIFLFALTPLPDDLLFIPLGFMHYNIIKALIACSLGKFCMALVIARFSGFVESALAFGWSTVLLMSLMLAVIVTLVLRIDWLKLAERRARRA